MLTKEELESWNTLFPDCKVRDSDLANPSEEFLTKTLISYLRMFGYKVEFPNYSATGDVARERRQFAIKLARHIDGILKITDKSYAFTYYDLLRPTPKKTSHMLGILLNYLYYYNMYKTDVFTMADERLKMRQELLDQIKKTQEENEQRKNKAAKIMEEVDKMISQIPREKAEMEGLKARKTKLDMRLKHLQDALNELLTKTEELKTQKRNLERQLVPENEGRRLHTQYEELQSQIADRQQQKLDMENEIKAQSKELQHIQVLLHNIDSAKKVLSPELLESYNEVKQNLETAKTNLNNVTQMKQNKLLMIEKQEQTLKSFEEKLKLEEKQCEQEKDQKTECIANKETVFDTQTQLLKNLKSEEHALECKIQQQKDLRVFIEQNVATLLAPYTNKKAPEHQ